MSESPDAAPSGAPVLTMQVTVYGSDLIADLRDSPIEGVSVVLDGRDGARGDAEVLAFLVSGLATPALVGVFSNWLYDRLRNRRDQVVRLVIDEEEVTLIPGGIERALRRKVDFSIESKDQ